MLNVKGPLAEIVEVILLALGLYLVITFAVQTVHVIGLSMYPTVDDSDYLIATKIDYRFHGPARGDIIIMRDPYDPSRDFIKRVVALPGERLQVKDAKVFVNGRRLEERYLTNPEPWTFTVNWPPPSSSEPDGRQLGPHEYFVMGDNRNHSSDSRLFGPVQRDQIEAHAWIRIIPLNQFGFIGGPRGFLDRPPAAARAA